MKNKGFTLLEVLLALSIMAIAITLIIQLFSSNIRTIALSGNTAAAAAKANARLRELLAEPSLSESTWRETETGYPMDISIAEVLQERTDNLPIRLMGVALTIHWQEGRKDKKLTLRSMKMIERTSFETDGRTEVNEQAWLYAS